MSPPNAKPGVLDEVAESLYQKGVKHLQENGISKVPGKYIFPASDRPVDQAPKELMKLPVINFAELQGPNRPQVLQTLANACEQYGLFQLVNHGISDDVTGSMIDVGKRFFELPFGERAKYMTPDMSAPVRYGTSFNQNKDNVFCWRDFLKLICHPLPDFLPHWPSSPSDLRELAATYADATRALSVMLVEAVLESLGLVATDNQNKEKDEEEGDKDWDALRQLRSEGSQLMVVNCYPACPEPDLTLGMPPHSDYGFLTLLLQDEVQGLQINVQEKWVTVEPLTNSFLVNVGDHLEIFSNGRYKSVLHRVLVNSDRSRVSVATLYSMPFNCTVRPALKLVNEANPRGYRDTHFADFLDYLSAGKSKRKSFLESRKLTT